MNFLSKILVLIAIFLLLGIYLSISGDICYWLTIVGLILSFFNLNKETKSVVLLMFSSQLLGTIFFVYNIHLVAYIFTIFGGVFFIRHNLLYFYDRFSGKYSWILLMLFFFLAYLLGPMHAYSNQKILMIFINSIVYILGWMICVLGRKVEVYKISLFILFVSLTYIAISFYFYDFEYPKNLSDLNFFRESYAFHFSEMPFSYHEVGVPAMIGLSFLLAYKKDDYFSFWTWILLLLLLMVVLISQARQAILGCMLLLLGKLFFDKEMHKRYKIFIIIFAAITILLSTNFFVSDFIAKSVYSGTLEGTINRDLDRAFEIISTDFLWGRGLGGYSMGSDRSYPHNLILELLCETGFIGLLIVLCILFFPLFFGKHKSLTLISNSKFIVILPMLAVGIRAMASSDLITSISFLVAIIVFVNVCIKSRKYRKL